MYKGIVLLQVVQLLFTQTSCQLNIQLYVPGQETRCISEIFHAKEHMLFSYNVSSINGKTLGTKKDDTDANISMYGRSHSGKSIFTSETNKYDFMHKIAEADKQITVCAENKNPEGETAQIYLSFKSSIHVNDFSNVATTGDIKTVNDATKALEGMIDELDRQVKLNVRESKDEQNQGKRMVRQTIVSFSGYAIGLIFLLGIAQVVYIRHQMRAKKLI